LIPASNIDTQPTLVTKVPNDDSMLLMGDVYHFAHNSYTKQCKIWTIFGISVGLGFNIIRGGEGGMFFLLIEKKFISVSSLPNHTKLFQS
jgi:hypothetical protein